MAAAARRRGVAARITSWLLDRGFAAGGELAHLHPDDDAARLYARRRQPAWTEPLDRRRVAVLWLLALGASAIKVTEDALGGDSGPIDHAVLLFLHAHVPLGLTGFFEAITLTASARALGLLTLAATLVLVTAKRRFEAWLLAGSVICAVVVVYAVKVLVGRARPALWDTRWYWGSSFPSGHTLLVAAFATATAHPHMPSSA